MQKGLIQIISYLNKLFKELKITWAIFAGVAVYLYGGSRKPNDVDVLIGLEDIARLSHFCKVKIQNIRSNRIEVQKICFDRVEVVSYMKFRRNGQIILFSFDDEMKKIRLILLSGIKIPVLSPEDNVIFKAIFQKEVPKGIHDIYAIARNQKLDRNYLQLRAKICNAEDIVIPFLVKIGVY